MAFRCGGIRQPADFDPGSLGLKNFRQSLPRYFTKGGAVGKSPIVAHSDAVIPATTVQLPEVWDLGQTLRGLGIGNQILNSPRRALSFAARKSLAKLAWKRTFNVRPQEGTGLPRRELILP